MSTTYGTLKAQVVADVHAEERALFIQRTYTHLAFAILAFVGLTSLIIKSPLAKPILNLFFNTHPILILVAFIGASWIAQSWANSATSKPMQYMGLGLYIFAESIIFTPILFIAANYSSPHIIPAAAAVTGVLFLALTFIAFTSKKDFSFLGKFLQLFGFIALGVVLCQLFFQFPLSTTLFAAVMVAFAGGCVLYDTSNVIHHYRTDQYVAASLELFASVALMFWYVLRLFMSRD
ncbi:MAG: Bax inhibitor-1 family protein [Candidatus Brocadiae bacterium]|nr:Bax inhibitor-1 family protein [Candidatus Brocadiia bacterium]